MLYVLREEEYNNLVPKQKVEDLEYTITVLSQYIAKLRADSGEECPEINPSLDVCDNCPVRTSCNLSNKVFIDNYE